jgi:diguanylate cyclase (GGDEF)-like protein
MGKTATRSARIKPCGRDALLDDALNSLPQGVVMFDETGAILVSNRRYVEMYKLSPEVVRPGCTLQELIAHRKDVGLFEGDIDDYCQSILTAVQRGETSDGYIETADGRTIHVVNAPTPSGGWTVTHEDVTAQRLAEAKITFMATHDTLTELPNRALFKEQLDQAIQLLPRDRHLALMFLDLDNFKGINDTLGHPCGDRLLKTVAERLKGLLRAGDMIARFGGDEFVIAAGALHDPAEAAAIAARIREEIVVPCDLGDHQVGIDTSIGIAFFPGDGETAEQLIKNADLALYSAKESGRGTYRFFETAMDTRMLERRQLEFDLRRGFISGELELYYQPLLDLESGQVRCCEALLRWHHPERGFILPDDFVPLAEEIGLIGRIGEWVIRSACAEAVLWPPTVSIAVNVSPVQFRSQNLVQIVTHALATSGLAPTRLEIEITEAIVLEHTEETLKTLRQLHDLGVRIVMDDFGTGYSSLSYLQKFPFDKIKIDQSFIRGLTETPEAEAIVRAVTSIANTLKISTTAEGVETAEQEAMVTLLGCTEIQGYVFSAARPAVEIGDMLAKAAALRQVA